MSRKVSFDGKVIAVPDDASDEEIAAIIEGSSPKETPAPPIQKASTSDKLLGSRAGRFALGASGLISGPLQLGANIGAVGNKYVVAPIADALGAKNVAFRAREYGSVVADSINEQMRDQQEKKRRGMDALGVKGADISGTLGAVTGGVVGGGPKVASTLIGKVGQGAGLGAAYGATAPVDTEDYWGTKALQTATGAVLGGTVPLVIAGASALSRGVRDVYDVAAQSSKGLERLRKAYYERLIGKDNIKSVASDLRSADRILPGGKPTAAEAVSSNPYGSPLQAQQQVTASTYGGPSGAFGERISNQQIVRGAAELERDSVTAPLREAALAKATAINKGDLANGLIGILGKPETQAVKPAREFLSNIANQAYAAGDDAQKLYAVRKYINDLIDKRVESPDNVAGYATTQLLAMKKVIDSAIENGGAGGSWGAYLKEYAKRSSLIDKFTERAENMYKPAQKTSVPGAASISESTATHLPNLLSRAAMITNYLARAARHGVEPELDKAMAADFLSPSQLANVLDPAQSQISIAVRNALARRPAGLVPLAATQSMRGE